MKVFNNKNAFQEDAYRLLVDHGGVHGACVWICVCPVGVCTGCVHTLQTQRQTPLDPEVDTPRGQTDTCENITFANFVCGR